MMKVCVISARYQLTGVALAQIRFARALAQRGHSVDLIFGCRDYAHLPQHARDLPAVPGVNVIDWGCAKVRSMFRPMCKYLRNERPDIVFSAEDHLNDLVLLAAIATRSRAMISGSSRVLPVDAVGHGGPYSNRILSRRWVFKQLTRALMWRADALTCVSQDMVTEYHKLFPGSPHVCVHNIIVDETSLERMKEPVEHPWFVEPDLPLITAAGTLTERKGFTDLIHAIGLLHGRKRQVRLAILGEGPLRQSLERLVRDLQIEDFVWLPGRVDNPLKFFARSQVSALSSYSEGLPNVLIEAMMCGCVPVATDCPTGPREVLQSGEYGYLVPMHDPVAMADGIEKALDTPITRDKLREGIRSFETQAVLDRHFEVLGLGNAA